MKYPYAPKSNRKFEAGEFWSIALSNGTFACGIILDIPNREKNRVLFLAGLTNWLGQSPPTEKDLIHSKLEIVKFGFAHIKTIKEREEVIRGKISIEQIDKQWANKKVNTWGYNVINIWAEKLIMEN